MKQYKPTFTRGSAHKLKLQRDALLEAGEALKEALQPIYDAGHFNAKTLAAYKALRSAIDHARGHSCDACEMPLPPQPIWDVERLWAVCSQRCAERFFVGTLKAS